VTKQPTARMYRGFTLDPFQEQAVDFIDQNKSVLVAAPTREFRSNICCPDTEMSCRTTLQDIFFCVLIHFYVA
jgi:hypothetical protein